MLRIDAMRAIYPQLEQCVVVTIMGAVSAELQSIGHQPNFFYLQHAMGLASSLGHGETWRNREIPVQREIALPERNRCSSGLIGSTSTSTVNWLANERIFWM